MVTETTPAATETVGKPAVLVVDDEYGPRDSLRLNCRRPRTRLW